MKTLIKLIFALIFLVIAAVAGGTYWFGMGLEQRQEDVARLASSQTGLIIKSTGFSKGLIDSSAMAMAMLPGVHIIANIEQKIFPGPLPLASLMNGQIDLEPVNFMSSGTIKLNGKKELAAADRAFVNRLPAASLSLRSNLLTEKYFVSIDVPSFKGKIDDTDISWPQTEFRFETNSQWQPVQLVSGATTLKLPASVIENLIRLQIHLDIENLKANRKLTRDEIKKLSPAAVRISVENALPGYIERYGIRNVLDNAKATNKPINVSFRPGQIKVGGVVLPR